MTAFADIPRKRHRPAAPAKPAKQEVETGNQRGGLRRAITACAGAALVMAAIGVWFIPAEDSAMRLIKLFVSAAMFGAGLLMFHGLSDRRGLPEVQLDPAKRQLRVYEYDLNGKSVLTACHDIDALSELSLTDQTLRARDAQGQLVVSVPIPNAASETAIREAISGHA
jgi:hypothetical protein